MQSFALVTTLNCYFLDESGRLHASTWVDSVKQMTLPPRKPHASKYFCDFKSWKICLFINIEFIIYIHVYTTRKGGPFAHEKDKNMTLFGGHHMCHGRSQPMWEQCHLGPVLFWTKYVSRICPTFRHWPHTFIANNFMIINEAAFTTDHVGGITKKYFRDNLFWYTTITS